MGKSRKKRICAFLLMLGFIVVLAACGSGATEEEDRNGGESLEEREIIRMGGFMIDMDTMERVHSFNQRSETHEIQVEDYWDESGFDLTMADRILAEFSLGHGPDIIYVGFTVDIFEHFMRQGMFLDLHPLIEADPDIDLSDFLPNLLEGGKAPDGSLAMIGNSFAISSMVGLADKLPSQDAWTMPVMLNLLDESISQGIHHPMGKFMTGGGFMGFVASQWHAEFIDWETGQSNFDSDEFIRILELAARMPQEFDPLAEFENEFIRMGRSEQLLSQVTFRGSQFFQELMAVPMDITILGIPTRDGGVHMAHPQTNMGIHINSPHAEAAWYFIRQSLLPETVIREESAIPLRIDRFEALLEETMNPLPGTRRIELGHGFTIELSAMTEEEASVFRDIVNSAIPTGFMGRTVGIIIEEEMIPFLGGDRSIEDTVRIIQNRAQTYLFERFS